MNRDAPRRLDRRQLLVAGVAAAAGALVAGGFWMRSQRQRRAARELVRGYAAGLFEGIVSVREVGLACLASAPEEADPETLLQRLVDALPGDPALASEAAFRAALAARIRDDFATGRVRRVQHWFLSETEARLAAAASLEAAPRG